jgi:LysM repeat protein
MRRDHRQLAHFGAPIVFLLAVTIFVLILRGGFGGGSDAKSSHTKPSTTASSTTTGTSTRTVTTRLYTIRYGDTLGAVAIHFGVTVDDIIALNPKIEPTALRVGQKIKVGKAPASK